MPARRPSPARPVLCALACLLVLTGAAASRKEKKPQPDSIKGEVVDLAAYLEDTSRKGETWAEETRAGLEKGHPVGIIGSDGTLYLAIGRDMKNANGMLAPYAGKRVKVTGKRIKVGKMSAFRVDHAQEQPSPPVKKKAGARKN